MPATYSVKCPECRTTLNSRRPIPGGKLLTCPKCDVMFAAPKTLADDVVEDVEVVEDDVEIVDDVEVVDEGPSRRPQRSTPARGPKPGRGPAVNSGIEVVDDEVEVIDGGDANRRPRKQFRSKKRGSSGKGLLIGAIAGGVVLLLGGVGLTWWLLSGGGDEPLAYLPSNSPFVGGADVKAILASPLGTPAASLIALPTMPFARLVAASGGTPMRDAFDRIVFGGGDSGITMVVKMSAPIDKGKLGSAFGNAPSTSVGGQSVFRPTGPGPKAMFVPNKKIAVFSDLPDDQLATIARSAGNKPAMSADLAALAAKFNTNTIWAVAGPEALSNPAFQSGMLPALSSSPAGKSIAPVMQSARGFGLSINLAGNDVDIRFGIQCSDDAAAQKAVTDLQQANEKSKSDLAAKALLKMAPPWAQKLQTELEGIQQISADGALAMIALKLSMSTLQEAIDAVAGMLPTGGPALENGAMRVPKGRRPGGN
jgi:hypothetical protein